MHVTTPRSALPHAALLSHERFLWGLCYRMTGSAADADDLVQETFARALARPPSEHDDLRPWLVRVATNLARDAYRQRRRRGYVGPWLPSPVDADDVVPSHEPRTTEGRYDLLESVSFAFLLALEALKPRERAVLVLRDVLDYSVREAADALAMTEANVKTTHHRARRAMAAYDVERAQRGADHAPRTLDALARFMNALGSQDHAALEAMLADSVRAVTDGGGELLAARVPVLGRSKVALFHAKLAQRAAAGATFEVRYLNGLPAVVVTLADGAAGPRLATRFVLRVEIDAEGAIREIQGIAATRKLTAVTFPEPPAPPA